MRAATVAAVAVLTLVAVVGAGLFWAIALDQPWATIASFITGWVIGGIAGRVIADILD